MRRAVAVAVTLFLAVGCTGSAPHPTAPPSGSITSDSGPTPRTPATQTLPPLVLRADLGEPAAKWRRVLFIPFGAREDSLGYKTFPDSPASQPSAFAVAPDGSFWIDDRWKARLAHYSPVGEYLGQVVGLDPRGWDVAIVDGQVYVLVQQETGTMGVIDGPVIRKIDVSLDGRALFAFQLIPTSLGLVAQVGGSAGGDGGEFHSFVRLTLPHVQAGSVLPGLPLGGDSYFDAAPAAAPVHTEGDQDFDLTFTSPQTALTQPIQVELTARAGTRRVSVPAEVGLLEPLPTGDDVVMYVEISPTRPDDADRYGDGRWLLRVGRSPLLWERLPSPDMNDELHHRHLAVGPDGAIYLMVTTKGGMLILERPPSGG